MTKNQLLKKLDAVMTEAERTNMWGEITIDVRKGEAVLLRKTTTEKLNPEEKYSYDNHNR
jgi:hypothetical protein